MVYKISSRFFDDPLADQLINCVIQRVTCMLQKFVKISPIPLAHHIILPKDCQNVQDG